MCVTPMILKPWNTVVLVIVGAAVASFGNTGRPTSDNPWPNVDAP